MKRSLFVWWFQGSPLWVLPHVIRAWAFRCQATLLDVSPYLVAFWVSDYDLYSLHCRRFLVQPSYCLAWVLAMDFVLYVCLWLDHYLHQHDRCGPLGATWLGGIATFTTARDWCTETVFHPSATVAGCSHLVLRVPEYTFLWFCSHWNVWISCLDDVSLFDTFLYYDV